LCRQTVVLPLDSSYWTFNMERRSIVVQGIVQGVGFRPFVYGLASRLKLHGFVKNRTGDVLIEVEGEAGLLDRFLLELTSELPPLAHIEELSWEQQSPRGERDFRIERSDTNAVGPIFVAADVATCDDCMAELFNPRDRRYRYPFLNCTNCGPRLTIVTGSPYDRLRTTMSVFSMCPECRAEYEDPANRRFHAEPTACPVCGPQLELLDSEGNRVETTDPLALFAAKLRAGSVGALKGVGGFHLTCDASQEAAVGALRLRKHRDEKPFAVMVRDVETAREYCLVTAPEEKLLTSPQRPIALLHRRASTGVAAGVAPGNPCLGVMLAYTPLHHLLLKAVGGIPLVMTSGNRSDEPIAVENHDALERLHGIADWFLIHDRPIHVRCDDSVARVVDGTDTLVRRSRGYAPTPIGLPVDCPHPILAVGAQLKSTFALGSGRHAVLSHHLGDLDHYAAFRAFERDILLYQRLFAIEPVQIAHDRHPDYASTGYAQQRAGLWNGSLEKRPFLVAVQHHHAHMASCMAEHFLIEPVIGVTFDGTGFGTDGAVWGGEFLVGDYRDFRRAGHLRYVGMPGGDHAIREPWRMAVAHLRDAGISTAEFVCHPKASAIRTIEQMLEKGINTPMTSSAGRLFDAVAALAGLRQRVSYEGQAAMEMEWLATGVPDSGVYSFELEEVPGVNAPEPTLVVDTRPLIRAVAADAAHGVPAAIVSRRFHTTMVDLIGAVCNHIQRSMQLDAVVLSGGVFMNALLSSEAHSRLTGDGFRVYRHRLVPPGDGGISLGQLAVAAALAQGASAGDNRGKGLPLPESAIHARRSNSPATPP
jgi:hydrogenase maturation protein HypF